MPKTQNHIIWRSLSVTNNNHACYVPYYQLSAEVVLRAADKEIGETGGQTVPRARNGSHHEEIDTQFGLFAGCNDGVFL